MRLDYFYHIEFSVNDITSFLQTSLFSAFFAATEPGGKSVHKAHAGVEVASWLEFLLLTITTSLARLLSEQLRCHKVIKMTVVEYANGN